MSLAQLMEKRAAKVRELRQIQDAANGADLTPEQRTAFDKIEGECRTLNEQIDRQTRLDALERSAAGTPLNGGTPDFDREAGRYSLVRAIAHASGIKVDASRELEVSAEIERRTGRKAQGIFAPNNITHVRKQGGFEQRVITSGGDGAGVISEQFVEGQFIDALRASLVTGRLGATTLSGLTGGPVSIPRQTEAGATAWMAENTALTPANRDFDKVTMTMKTVGALTEYSRNLLIQSSPDIEMLLRRDFASQLAIALDAAALSGGGANEPDGILALLTAASALGTLEEASWPQVLAMIATIESANAAVGSMGWAVHPRVVQTLRSTVKVKFGSPETQDAGAGFVMEEPGSLAGFAAASTTSLPLGGSPPSTGTAIFGDFSSLLIGYYSGIDVLVNPFESTAYAKGNVSVRGLLSCDVAVRHLASFTAATDVPVTV